MIKHDTWNDKKNEDDKINDKNMMNVMITKMIKKWKKLFWPGPVCGCKFFINLI